MCNEKNYLEKLLIAFSKQTNPLTRVKKRNFLGETRTLRKCHIFYHLNPLSPEYLLLIHFTWIFRISRFILMHFDYSKRSLKIKLSKLNGKSAMNIRAIYGYCSVVLTEPRLWPSSIAINISNNRIFESRVFYSIHEFFRFSFQII